MTPTNRQQFLRASARVVRFLEILGAIVAIAAMLGFFIIGFWEVLAGFKNIAHPTGPTSSAVGTLVHAALSGLELFLLAPLPYLAFIGIIRLVQSTIAYADDKNRGNLQIAHEDIAHVKHLITGLMIAVLATEIIHRTIGGSSDATAAAGSWPIGDMKTEALMLVLMAVLILYYSVSNRK